jgi:hypothetical protein
MLFWLWNFVSVWRMALTSVHHIIGGGQTHEHGIKVLYCVWCSLRSLESSVRIVTRLQAGQPRYHSIARGGKISTRVSILAIEPTLLPVYCVQSALSLAVKHTGHECDYLSPSTVEFKNEWSYVTTHPNAWVACTWLMTLFCVDYCQRKVTVFSQCWQLQSLYSCDIQMCDTTEILCTLISQPVQTLRVMGTSSWVKPCCTDFLWKE